MDEKNKSAPEQTWEPSLFTKEEVYLKLRRASAYVASRQVKDQAWKGWFARLTGQQEAILILEKLAIWKMFYEEEK